MGGVETTRADCVARVTHDHPVNLAVFSSAAARVQRAQSSGAWRGVPGRSRAFQGVPGRSELASARYDQSRKLVHCSLRNYQASSNAKDPSRLTSRHC